MELVEINDRLFLENEATLCWAALFGNEIAAFGEELLSVHIQFTSDISSRAFRIRRKKGLKFRASSLFYGVLWSKSYKLRIQKNFFQKNKKSTCFFGKGVLIYQSRREVRQKIRVWRSLVSRLNGVQEASSSNLDTRTKNGQFLRKLAVFLLPKVVGLCWIMWALIRGCTVNYSFRKRIHTFDLLWEEGFPEIVR